MVVDTMENLEKYVSLNPLFEEVVKFVKEHDLMTLEVGKHPYDLVRSNQIFAHFDFWQRGIGNRSCGGDSCLPQYMTPTGAHEFTLRFTPMAK